MKRLFIITILLAGLTVPAISQTTGLKWYSLSEAMKLNQTTPKKFLIDIYTDWCGWCKVMDKNTFGHSKIAAIINTYFYAVKFNAEKDADIEFKGKTYKLNIDPNTKKGYNELTPVLMNNQSAGYPSICYMDETLTIIQTISGYQTPEQIEPILKFFGSNAYKETDWQTFTASFQSELK